MSPDRREIVNGVLIEQYYWAGKMVVYVDHYISNLTFEQAVAEAKMIARTTDGKGKA